MAMDFITKEIDTLLGQLSAEMEEDKIWLLAQVYDDLAGEEDPININKYIEEVIKKGLLGWNHHLYKKIKQSQQEQDDYILNPYEVEEGVVQCKKCKGFKVFSVSQLTRSADEPMTTMATCAICRTSWSYN
jgi:DNA-directed RNA polymerase subunit M/transcription elongation factor TFIIS